MSHAWSGSIHTQLRAVDFTLSADTERSVRRTLQRMFRTYEDTFHLRYPQELQLNIDLIESRAAYNARAQHSGIRGPTLGFFLTQSRQGVVWRNPDEGEMRGTLIHEASHFLMAAGGAARVPRWIQEGMAELFEGARTDGNAVYLDPPPYLRSWLSNAKKGLPPLATMLGERDVWRRLPATPVGGAEYGVGWALCAFLMKSERGKSLLANLMQTDFASPEAQLPIVEARWPGGVEALDREWRAWLDKPVGPLQLPVPTVRSAADGWIRCANGTLLSKAGGGVCGQWVPDENGVMTYEEEPR